MHRQSHLDLEMKPRGLIRGLRLTMIRNNKDVNLYLYYLSIVTPTIQISNVFWHFFGQIALFHMTKTGLSI